MTLPEQMMRGYHWWLMGLAAIGLVLVPVLGQADGPATADPLETRIAVNERRLANLEKLLEIDLADTAAVDRRIAERRRVEIDSTVSMVRAQLELYKLQHHGRYPDLVGKGWAQLTHTTNANGDVQSRGLGPYMRRVPVNPVSGTATVVAARSQAGPSAGWIYNRESGLIKMVMPKAAVEAYGLDRRHVYVY